MKELDPPLKERLAWWRWALGPRFRERVEPWPRRRYNWATRRGQWAKDGDEQVKIEDSWRRPR